MMKIWITRDEDSCELFAWTSKPEESQGTYFGCGGDSWEIGDDQGQLFIANLLGDEWLDDGLYCASIEIAAVKRSRSSNQLMAEKLRKMTKANFRKATINEAIALLEVAEKGKTNG